MVMMMAMMVFMMVIRSLFGSSIARVRMPAVPLLGFAPCARAVWQPFPSALACGDRPGSLLLLFVLVLCQLVCSEAYIGLWKREVDSVCCTMSFEEVLSRIGEFQNFTEELFATHAKESKAVVWSMEASMLEFRRTISEISMRFDAQKIEAGTRFARLEEGVAQLSATVQGQMSTIQELRMRSPSSSAPSTGSASSDGRRTRPRTSDSQDNDIAQEFNQRKICFLGFPRPLLRAQLETFVNKSISDAELGISQAVVAAYNSAKKACAEFTLESIAKAFLEWVVASHSETWKDPRDGNIYPIRAKRDRAISVRNVSTIVSKMWSILKDHLTREGFLSPLKPDVKFGSNFKGGDLWITDGIDIWIPFRMEFNQDCSEARIMPGGDLQR